MKMGFRTLLLGAAMIVSVVEAGHCWFLNSFQKSTSENGVCIKQPEAWDDIDKIEVSFTCTNYKGHSMELGVYQSVWGFDDYALLYSIPSSECDSDRCTIKRTISIPRSLRSCKPSEKFYFKLEVDDSFIPYRDSDYEGCEFLPRNYQKGLTSCDKITYPTRGKVVATGPTRVDWNLAEYSEWKDWSMEIYLYRETALLDPWWFAGATAAQDETLSYNLEDLNLSTDLDAKYYAAAYYRRWKFFTWQVAESERFSINDRNPNDNICSFVQRPDEYALVCCSSKGETTNDICRVGLGDVQLAVEDLEVALPYGEDMCQQHLQFRVSPYLVYTDGHPKDSSSHIDGPGHIYRLEEPYTKDFASFSDIADAITLSVTVLDTKWLAGLPTKIGGGTLSLELAPTCKDNALGLKLTLNGEVKILDKKKEGDLELYEWPGLVPLPTSPNNAPPAIAPTAGPSAVYDGCNIVLLGLPSSLSNLEGTFFFHSYHNNKAAFVHSLNNETTYLYWLPEGGHWCIGSNLGDFNVKGFVTDPAAHPTEITSTWGYYIGQTLTSDSRIRAACECPAACQPGWPGDGYCDAACMFDACGYDNGDCQDATCASPARGCHLETDFFVVSCPSGTFEDKHFTVYGGFFDDECCCSMGPSMGPSTNGTSITAAPTSTSVVPTAAHTQCNNHSQCGAGEYCDNYYQCFTCTYITVDTCDSFDGCCSLDFLTQCTSNPHNCSAHSEPSAACVACDPHLQRDVRRNVTCVELFQNTSGIPSSLSGDECCLLPWVECLNAAGCVGDPWYGELLQGMAPLMEGWSISCAETAMPTPTPTATPTPAPTVNREVFTIDDPNQILPLPLSLPSPLPSSSPLQLHSSPSTAITFFLFPAP